MISPDQQLARTGARIAGAGYHVALYGTVLVLASIGGLKFTAYEAEAIRPLVETSPLLSWAYAVFSVQAFSNLLGVIELTTALLLALAPWDARAGALGASMASATFAITSTFLITGPAWEPSLGGFPALSGGGGFLVKDLVLLGVALSVLGHSLARLSSAARDHHAGAVSLAD